MSLPEKFKKINDIITRGNIYPTIKSVDEFLSKNFFDKDTFNKDAWYYNKDKVFDYLLKNIPTHTNRQWFEEDEFDVLSAYFKFLCNYESFVLLVIILYFWFLVGLLFCAYWLFYVPLLF